MTNTTRGTVVGTDFATNFAGELGTECLLVKVCENDRRSSFVEEGDSGSLVIRRLSDDSIEAIGILSHKLDEWHSPDGVHRDVAIIVLLTNCFDALKLKYGKMLKLDRNWEMCETQPISDK